MIDHLELGKVTLVAQSMGGFACLPYALAHPTKVKALVLASTTGPLRTGPSEGASESLTSLRARGINAAAGARMALEQPELHELYTLIDRLSAGPDRQRAMTELMSLAPIEVDHVAALRCPVLWIGGAEDVFSPAHVQEARLRAMLPRWQLRVVSHAGHSVYFERAQLFNTLVTDFLASAAQP